MKTKKEIDFDPVSDYYDFIVSIVFRNHLLRAQIRFLNFIPDNSEILVLGGGTGKFLPDMLARVNNIKELTYLDNSGKMLAKARAKTQNLTEFSKVKTISWVKGNEYDIDLNKNYDVVIAFFFFDLFNHERIKNIFNILKDVFKKEGVLLFADFNIDRNYRNNWWKKILIRIMYLFFNIICCVERKQLPDFDHYFYNFGFRKITQKKYYHNMVVSSVYKIEK